MKKHILILGLIFVFFGLVTYAQTTTVSIPDTTTARGEISLPVEVDPDLGDVGSLTLRISYDPDVLEFLGFSNNPFEGDPNFLSQTSNGELSVVWFGTTAVEIGNKLFDLDFDYSGGNSALEFTGTNEITDEEAQAYNITFVDGSVGELPATLTLSDEIAIPGDLVYLELTAKNLMDIGSMSLFFNYDPDELTFIGADEDIVGFEVNDDGNGTLGLAWFSTTPATYNNNVLVELAFGFSGDAGSLVEFLGNTEITDGDGNPIAVVLNDGSIMPPSATLGLSDEVACPNSEVFVSLFGTLLDNLGSFTLDVNYDPDVMTYNRYVALDVPGSLEANVVAPGQLRLAYFNTAGLNLNSGDLVDLVFDYTTNTAMTSTISITEIEITDPDGNPIAGFAFSEGTITENSAPIFTSVIGDTTISENETLTFNYVATDVDLQFLTYDASFGTIDQGLGEFEWTPGFEDAGIYLLEITVTDGCTFTSIIDTITVLETNRPPVFTQTIDGETFTPISTLEGWVEHTFNYMASDPDGDDVTFSLVSGPNGSSISANGVFSWVLDDQYALQQDVQIVVSASDGTDATNDTSYVDVDNVVGVNDEAVPTEYSLKQNYPNPFNPTTAIKFGLPQASDVTIKIFNLLGQEVKTLVNKGMDAGFHVINFDASNLISGLYIYRIQAFGNDGANFVDVKKMLLVK